MVTNEDVLGECSAAIAMSSATSAILVGRCESEEREGNEREGRGQRERVTVERGAESEGRECSVRESRIS